MGAVQLHRPKMCSNLRHIYTIITFSLHPLAPFDRQHHFLDWLWIVHRIIVHPVLQSSVYWIPSCLRCTESAQFSDIVLLWFVFYNLNLKKKKKKVKYWLMSWTLKSWTLKRVLRYLTPGRYLKSCKSRAGAATHRTSCSGTSHRYNLKARTTLWILLHVSRTIPEQWASFINLLGRLQKGNTRDLQIVSSF